MALITENFDKANGALGPNQSWTALSGIWAVDTLRCKQTATAAIVMVQCDAPLGTVNHEVEAQVDVNADNASNYPMVMARMGVGSAANYYSAVAAFTENTVDVRKCVSTSESILDSISVALTGGSGGHLLRLRTENVGGNVNLKVYVDGVLKIDFTDMSSPIVTGTYAGLASYISTGQTFHDNFRAEDIGAVNPVFWRMTDIYKSP